MVALRGEAYLNEAQRLSRTGSFGWNVSSGEIYWTEESYNVFGYDREVKPSLELIFQRIHPDDIESVQRTIDRGSEARSDLDFEHRLLMPDGMVKHLHVLARASKTPQGDLEYIGAVTDVSAAKQAEIKLREGEAYLAEAQRLSHSGSWAWNPATGENRYWSDECFRIMGFDPAGGMPNFETVAHRFHPDDQPIFSEKLERARRERTEFEVDYRIIHPDGEIRYIHAVGHPVLGPSGDLVEFVGSVIDVTERRRADEALRQAQTDLAHANRVSSMGELTAFLAHEVNQPIAAAVTDASTCLRWLAHEQPDLNEARAAASRSIKDATRAAEIIKRVRLLFKKGTPERELVDMNEVSREMIVLLHSMATQCGVFVRSELTANLPRVMGDRVQLQQVLMNLMINSIDAMKVVDRRRELTLQSQRGENGHVLISVSDTGVGLPPQQADKIFGAFFTTKTSGTGMGLRISRTIVESHGGTLWADENYSSGAKFCFTLPTCEPIQAPDVSEDRAARADDLDNTRSGTTGAQS